MRSSRSKYALTCNGLRTIRSASAPSIVTEPACSSAGSSSEITRALCAASNRNAACASLPACMSTRTISRCDGGRCSTSPSQ